MRIRTIIFSDFIWTKHFRASIHAQVIFKYWSNFHTIEPFKIMLIFAFEFRNVSWKCIRLYFYPVLRHWLDSLIIQRIFSSFTHIVRRRTRLLRTVGEFYLPLCVILLLGFIFSLNGCSFCFLYHIGWHVCRESLTLIDWCEKVMFAASGASTQNEKKAIQLTIQ